MVGRNAVAVGVWQEFFADQDVAVSSRFCLRPISVECLLRRSLKGNQGRQLSAQHFIERTIVISRQHGADRDVVAATVIAAIDQHIADAGCAQFAEGDFWRVGHREPSCQAGSRHRTG
jgi:hypothetical protein